MNKLNDEHGFMMFNVVILTLITALAATILINAAPRVRNPQAVLELTAIHLANERLAILESLAADGKSLTEQEDFQVTSYNLGEENPVVFIVKSNIPDNINLDDVTSLDVTITVSMVGNENFKLETGRTIQFVPQNQTTE